VSPGASAGAINLELRLLKQVAEGGLGEPEADAHIAELRTILKRGASQRQLSSLLDYAELLQVLSEGATHKKTSFRPQGPPLKRIADAMKEWMAET
jgi:hypothetical protein